MKRLIMAVLAVLAAAGIGAAVAQITAPGLFIASPTGNEQINVLNNGPQITTVRLSQIRDATGYVKLAPTTGQTIQYPQNTSHMTLTPAGTLSALTILTPASPFDGSELCVFSTQSVTTLTMTASAGQTLNGPFTGLTANASAPCWVFSLSNATWDRVE